MDQQIQPNPASTDELKPAGSFQLVTEKIPLEEENHPQESREQHPENKYKPVLHLEQLTLELPGFPPGTRHYKAYKRFHHEPKDEFIIHLGNIQILSRDKTGIMAQGPRLLIITKRNRYPYQEEIQDLINQLLPENICMIQKYLGLKFQKPQPILPGRF